MAAQPGDSKYHILWKLVELEGGTPRQGDSIRDLLAKYLTAIGGTPVQGDHFNNLLAKVVIIKGGTPLPGDHEWELLRKWLEAEGECRACGDSIHDLWRKILALGESEPEPTAPEVRVQQGATVITDGQAGAIVWPQGIQGNFRTEVIFTVYNDGDAPLLLSGLSVPGGFLINDPLAASIAPGANDVVRIHLETLGPGTVGVWTGSVSFTTNDADENPFNFPVSGTVINPITIDLAESVAGSPWQAHLTWSVVGDEPHWFGIEVNIDGGGWQDIEFMQGSIDATFSRDHVRDTDDGPHTYKFRIACFDDSLIQFTDWVESAEFSGPP